MCRFDKLILTYDLTFASFKCTVPYVAELGGFDPRGQHVIAIFVTDDRLDENKIRNRNIIEWWWEMMTKYGFRCSTKSCGLALQLQWYWKQYHTNIYVIFTIEEFSSKIKQIHFWYFWEKQVSLTEFIHMSMRKQNLDFKKSVCVSYLDLNFTLLLALM